METISLKKLANREKARILQGFFKTRKGEYGEGDVFLGITVPQTRAIARANRNAPRSEVVKLLKSKFHEERLLALLILVEQFNRGNEREQSNIVDFYLKNTKSINNWDLVDLSADKILGSWLTNRPRKILYTLSKSKNMWERRIAIVATFSFIRNKESADTFKIAEALMDDQHDLIHKAVGWMLREVGKRVGEKALENFLHTNGKRMPRTMLRYAIEHLSEEKRRGYLSVKRID